MPGKKRAPRIPLVYLIAFIGAVGCQQKSSNGSELAKVISTDTLVYDTAPRWMKTGNKILFYTYRHDPEGAELYAVFPDGTGLARLTSTYHNEWWSDISPIDESIFVSSDFGKYERFGGSEIYALKANGDFTRLTFDSDSNTFNIYPRVSPDGSRLLYCGNCLGKDVDSEVILIQSDGTNPENLTYHPSADKYGGWSPDGTRILFESNRSGNFQLYTLDLATRELTQLTDGVGDNKHGDWSIDDKIVFISNRDGDYELFVMGSDGANQQQITFNEDNDVLPSWSPDGSRIAFSSYRYGEKNKGDIFLIDPDGSNEFRLTKK